MFFLRASSISQALHLSETVGSPHEQALSAAGIKLDRAPGWQWYGLTATNWDLPESVLKNPAYRTFYFEDDRKLMERVIDAKGGA